MAATAIVLSRMRIDAPDIDAPVIGSTEPDSWSESALLIRPTMPVPPSGSNECRWSKGRAFGSSAATRNWAPLSHARNTLGLAAADSAMQRRSAIRSRGAEPTFRRLGRSPKAVTPAPPTSWRTAGATRLRRSPRGLRAYRAPRSSSPTSALFLLPLEISRRAPHVQRRGPIGSAPRASRTCRAMTWAVQRSAPNRPIDLPKVPAAWCPIS